jgi:putative DNA primase/helicase
MTDAPNEPKAEIDWNAEIARLAALDPLTYETVRKEEAKRLGVDRVSVLDDAVKGARPRSDDAGDKRAGSAFEIADIEPWDDDVDGAALLDEIAATFRRFLSLPDGAADVLALWALYTFAFERFFISPRLVIRSPEKQCGKSTLLRLLALVCNRVLLVANISAASLFRVVEAERPTLLLDEFDSFGLGNEDIRNVVNSGHGRDGCTIRCDGDKNEPRRFSTWAPVALASIGRIADTLEDRSVIVMMQRKAPGERFDRLRGDRPDQFDGLRRRAARWVYDARQKLEDADPDAPTFLNDRAADNWRPLLAIADAAGEDWPQRARDACKVITGAAAEDGDQDSTRTALLRDIRTVFSERKVDEITSADLCDALAADDGGPWAAYGRSEKPITPVGVARLLKPFRIRSKDIRNGQIVRKTYERRIFADAWARYLPPERPIQTATPQQPNNANDLGPKSTRYNGAAVADEKQAQAVDKTAMLRRSGSEVSPSMKWGEI